MNLLERIKPEVLEAIEKDAEKYPYMIASLKKELEKEEISPLYLSVNTAINICQYNNTNLDVINFLDCFNK
jgi:hypothetical protein